MEENAKGRDAMDIYWPGSGDPWARGPCPGRSGGAAAALGRRTCCHLLVVFLLLLGDGSTGRAARTPIKDGIQAAGVLICIGAWRGLRIACISKPDGSRLVCTVQVFCFFFPVLPILGTIHNICTLHKLLLGVKHPSQHHLSLHVDSLFDG